MARNSASRSAFRRQKEEEFERQRQAEAEALEAKDRTDLEYLIDFECKDMDDIRYILKRMAKVQALQLKLLKGMVK